MSLMDTLTAQPAPITVAEDGVLRIADTRVRLDTVIGAFNAGSAPEEILLKYPTLDLTDIYAVITYYLWHRDEVEAYLRERVQQAEGVQKENEARFPAAGVRDRLLSRRKGGA
jgi:uncharacterized protein (DUF433 family)